MMIKIIILFTVISLACALSCKCNKDKCKVAKGCQGEPVMDICGCCQVCGKTEGQPCGGQFYLQGRCVKGFRCFNREKDREVNGLEDLGYCDPLPRRDRAAHRRVMKGKKFLKAVLKSKRLVKRFSFASKKHS